MLRHTVFEGTVALHFLKGKLMGVLSPGKYVYWMPGHLALDVETRPRMEVIGGQEVTTVDNAQLRISVVVDSQITDPAVAFRSGLLPQTVGQKWHTVEYMPLHVTAQVLLREWVSTLTLTEALDQRAELAPNLEAQLGDHFAPLGIKINRVQLLDFGVSGSLKASASEILKAEMEGKAALARARNEAATMRSLLNTAMLVRENPKLLELRILSTGQKPRVTFVVHSEGANSATNADEGSVD